MRVLTPEQMRLAERKSGEYGITLAKLMDNAGKALAQAINDINDTVKPEHINCKERRATLAHFELIDKFALRLNAIKTVKTWYTIHQPRQKQTMPVDR